MVAIAVITPSPTLAGDDATTPSIVAVRIATDTGEVRGTAVLIHREDGGNGVVLHFLTSSRLFETPDGWRDTGSRAVHVRLDDGRVLDVNSKDVLVASGFVDVAILRVTTAHAAMVPRPVIYEPPTVGTVFLISGHDQNDAQTNVVQHVRFESTLLAVGDRDASGLAGCVGAPAMSPDGVFGVVSECDSGRPPVIALLPMARPFINRYLPRQTTHRSPTPQFGLVERQVMGPLLLVGCNATNTGELDVPFHLGSRESVVDATAGLVSPHEVRLADITVLSLEDRSVRLRFTLGGSPTPPAPPASCPQGQALVTLHLRLAVTPSP
jgi:hypothetical protein